MEILMKKAILTILILMMLALSACSGQGPVSNGNVAQPVAQVVAASTSTPTEVTASAAVTATNAPVNADLNALQLLLGTLKLVGTDQAITKEQAAALLPLWTNLQTLTQSMGPGQGNAQASNTDTQAKIDNLVKQIAVLMTPAQIKAISEMKITQESAMTAMQELGITMGGPQSQQGTPPAGGPGGNSGQQPANELTRPDGGMLVPPPLIDALIQALQKILDGETVSAASASSTANQGSAPAGNPPSGAPPAGNGASNAESGLSTATGAYTLSGKTDNQTDQTYIATKQDQSGVYVLSGGKLTLKNATVNTSGDTSSDENSSFYGLNAGVLAASGSAIDMTGGTINTTGTGANGAFATGSGSIVNLTDITITASGDGGHGVMATQGGAMTLTNVNMTTSGAHSAPIATDRGGGTITATGGILNTTGQDSPCYYSTGTLTISNSACNAVGSEVAVIEGANTVNLTDSNAVSSVANKWAVMIYQSFSGDAQGSDGIFNMTGGSLSYTDKTGPLFYVTNTNGHITLKNVTVSAASGILLKAEGNDRWGTSSSNGGTVEFIADAQTLIGNFVADKISTIALSLKNGSALNGAINTENTAKAVNLTLDSTSTWSVTVDSHISCLSDSAISGTVISNIVGNGHTVTYDSNACTALGGQTYTLKGGGVLIPK
jgi:hypothetical protein